MCFASVPKHPVLSCSLFFPLFSSSSSPGPVSLPLHRLSLPPHPEPFQRLAGLVNAFVFRASLLKNPKSATHPLPGPFISLPPFLCSSPDPSFPMEFSLFPFASPISRAEIPLLLPFPSPLPQLAISLQQISFTSSLASPDPVLLGFFLLSDESLLQAIFESQQQQQEADVDLSVLPPRLQEIIALFQSISEPKAKYQQLLHYGAQLPPLDLRFKTEDPAAVRFEAYSDSALTKGLAALLVFGLSGSAAPIIAAIPPGFVSLSLSLPSVKGIPLPPVPLSLSLPSVKDPPSLSLCARRPSHPLPLVFPRLGSCPSLFLHNSLLFRHLPIITWLCASPID